MHPSLRVPLARFSAILLACLPWMEPSALAQTNASGERFPALLLPKRLHANEIPAYLGANLNKVSAWYGRNPEQLHGLCTRDHSVRADRGGRLHYACSGLMVAEIDSNLASAATPRVSAAAFPVSETFYLHSSKGASKVIYLDFNGHTTTGTYWNDYSYGAPIVTPCYSIDSNTSSFSADELLNIQAIWQQVAEDFAPFEVDVTTQDPGVEALRKTNSTDTSYGVRVCIGGSCYDWFGEGAGGVAFMNSFGWNSDTPCFIFAKQLGNGYPKYTAEAVSHEVGHTFNLSHDGQSSEEYYEGHANWAPIMGVGYYRQVTQWSKGDYGFATNTEDDTAKIAKVAGYRQDKHGDDILNATSLPGYDLSASGIIERRGDADLFRFLSGSGPVDLVVNPDAVSPNLDIQLSLYSGTGDLITSTSPSTLGAPLKTTLAQGTYYLCVEGAGTGDPRIAYDNYGSLGQFTLSGSVAPCTGKPPVAVADNSAPLSGRAPLMVRFSSAGSRDPDGIVTSYSWDFGDGATSTAENPVHSFVNAGTYTASLVVTDNSGLSSPIDTVTITVQKAKLLYVGSIAISLTSGTRGYQATAKVTVLDHTGAVKPGATVTGAWSGLTSATASKPTNTSGKATFTSDWTKKRGTFTFSVSNVSLTGFGYSPAQNAETQDSIATP